MRRLPAVVLFAFVVLLARTAAGEDPKTYTLPKHETWKVGDTASRTSSEHQVEKQIVKGADGKVMKEETKDEIVDYSEVIRVDEVNGEGQFTKATVFFTTWSQKVGTETDTSLTGKHVEVTGAGTARTAKVVAGGEASAKAAAWLKKQFASKEEAEGAFLAPDHPLAVGESWSPDFAAVAKAFGGGEGGDKMKFVPEKSKVTCTLVSVEGDAALVRLDFDLQAGPMQGPAGPMEWTEGGKLTIKAEGHKALTAGDHSETMKMTGGFTGKLSPGPVVVEVNVTTENAGESKDGGEMPPLPTAK